MPELTFTTKGDVTKAFLAMKGAQEAAAKSTGGLNEKLQLTSRQVKELDKLQQDMVRRYESAQARYVRKTEEARRALAGHKHEAELLRRVNADLLVQYLRQADAGRNTWTRQKEAAAQVEAKAKALAKELAKLPPLYDQSEREARQFAFAVDLGTKNALKTKQEILGIKEANAGAFGAGVVMQVGAVAGSVMSLHKAWQLVNEEMQLQQELVDKRNEAQLTVSGARNQLIRTLVGSSDADKQSALAASAAIAAETGVSETVVAPALGDAISAIGGDVGRAVAATRVAATYYADRPQDVTEFAGSLLDVSKATGTSDAWVNLGLYQMLGQLSRVNDPNYMQQTIPSALVGMGSFGVDYAEAGAAFAALSNAASDKYGRSTRTAAVALAEQLSGYMEELGVRGLSFDDQLRLLHNNSELAEQFFRKRRNGGFGTSFERKTLGAVRDLLLDPDSQAAREYDKALAAIPDVGGLRREGEQAVADLARLNPLNSVAAFERSLTSGLEQLRTRMAATGSLSQKQRDDVRSMLQEAGVSGLGAKFQNWVQGLGDGGPGMTTESALRMVRLARQANIGSDALKTFGGQIPLQEVLSPEQWQREQILARVAELLERAERERKSSAERQTRALENIEQNTRNGGLAGNGS